MGKTFESINEELTIFVEKQQMFFVGSAPLGADGLVNISPKGLDSFRITGEREVAYLDLSGSGIETVAHVKENGRLVIMFCAFEGPPRIVRFHGKARVLETGQAEFDRLLPSFPSYDGTRAIIVLSVDRISDSCGFAVPLFAYQGQRDVLLKSAKNKGVEGLRKSQIKGNLKSLDGLVGLEKPSV